MNEYKLISILVSTHKEVEYPNNQDYIPVHSGKAISDIELGYVADNTGDNISSKNKNYCELTTLYWGWKNLNNLDFIGLCHYRRYFLFNQSISYFAKRLPFGYKEFFYLAGAIKVDATLLRKYDFILPEPLKLGKSMFNDYAHWCKLEDFHVLGEVINELCPEYYQSFINLVHGEEELSPFNMMLTSKTNWVKYCEWLFPILFEVEKRIKISNDLYQSRVFGFMAERLLNVYVFHNCFNVKYLPVIKLEETAYNKSLPNLLLKLTVSIFLEFQQ